MKQFTSGLTSWWLAVQYLRKTGRYKLVLVPAGISLVIFGSLLALALYRAPELGQWVWQYLAPDGDVPGAAIASLVLKMVAFALVVLVFLFGYKILMINLMAPLLIFVTESVLTDLYGKEQEIAFNWSHFLRSSAEGLLEALRLLGLELLVILTILTISLLLPIFSPLAPIALLLAEAWFVGLAMVDYTSGFFGYRLRRIRVFRKQYRSFALGNGLVFSLLMLVPVAGVLLAPSLAAIGSAVGIFKLRAQKNTPPMAGIQ